MKQLRSDAEYIIRESIRAVLPGEAVRRALAAFHAGSGKTILIAAGKAAWQMAKDAVDVLGSVDGNTLSELAEAGLDVYGVLQENDSYHALKAVDGLIMTGPTGTNVNDVAVALLRG